MINRIEKDFYFLASVHYDNKFYVNSYDISLSLLVETSSNREQNIAMERITYYIRNMLENCIFVHYVETDTMKQYKTAGMNVCELPEQPFDQIVGMVLLNKLNAIMEDRLKISDMVIGSYMSEGVRHSIVSEEAEHILDGNNWYNNSSLSISNETSNTEANVLRLFFDDEWADLGLTWKEKVKN